MSRLPVATAFILSTAFVLIPRDGRAQTDVDRLEV
jgi:hypothetical protein